MKSRIGVIGCGIYGTEMLKAYSFADKKGDIELVAISDIDEKVLSEQEEKFNVTGYLDYKEMLDKENLDAVAIVTPDYLHREIAVHVANRGVHMLVQKPLDTDVEGANKIIQAAKDNNVLLYVDFHKRFDPGHISIKKDIVNGNLGKVEYGYVWMEDKIVVPSEWFKDWAHNSSPAWFLGIHFYDLIYWLIDSKPKQVYATGVKKKLAEMGIDTYDSIQSKIEFENNITFTVDSSWIIPNSFPSIVNQGIRVVGSEGVWEADSQDRGLLYSVEKDEGSTVPNPYGNLQKTDPFYGSRPSGYVIESMLYFLELITKLKEGVSLEELKGTYPDGEDALISTKICEATHLSLEKEEIITID